MINPPITVIVVRDLQLTEPKSNLKGFNRNTTPVESGNKGLLYCVCIQVLFISLRK